MTSSLLNLIFNIKACCEAAKREARSAKREALRSFILYFYLTISNLWHSSLTAKTTWVSNPFCDLSLRPSTSVFL